MSRPQKWAIEDSFPIVEISRLAVPERNAFKPIYQMHKWFARRASCVFRAILLGCLKPLPVDENGNPTKSGAQTIMEEFYKDHTRDSDTNGKVILDPFMGGDTHAGKRTAFTHAPSTATIRSFKATLPRAIVRRRIES